jgi:hemoglobin
MKKDILNRNDIEILVNSFYEKVKKDEVIGYIFNDVAQVNWEKHLPVMYNFWENVLFYTGAYAGNPMDKHEALDKKTKLNKQHFEQWNRLFSDTVDEYFEGSNAELIKQRALSIATVMQIKLFS